MANGSIQIPGKVLEPWFDTGEKYALQKMLSFLWDEYVQPALDDIDTTISGDVFLLTETNQTIEGDNIFQGDQTFTGDVIHEGDVTFNGPVIFGDTVVLPGNIRYQSWAVACSDRTTALATNTKVGRFRVPYGFTIVGVMADLGTAQTSGSVLTVDINKNGSTILSTKLTLDNGELTSLTAAVAAVLSDTTLAAGDEVTFDIDQVGDGTAKWLQCTVYGYQT